MNKRIFFFIILLTGLFESCFSKTKSNTKSDSYYTNEVIILGYSTKENCIGILSQKRNTGKGDIKYQYLVFDLEKNKIVDSLKSEYICSLYGEESILSDWDDEKYGFNKFLDFKQQDINSINAKHGINIKEIDSIQISEFNCDSEIKDSSPLSESLNFTISFILNGKHYSFDSSIYNQEFIKTISLEKAFLINDYIVLKISKLHQGFEAENYKDFMFFGVKK